MNQWVRFLVLVALAACGVVIVALAFGRHNADLMAPLNLVLFVVAILVYLLPTGLAIYRDCKSTAWITVVNVLLGWTIFGWFVALGWAAAGKIRRSGQTVIPPPTHLVRGQ